MGLTSYHIMYTCCSITVVLKFGCPASQPSRMSSTLESEPKSSTERIFKDKTMSALSIGRLDPNNATTAH
eukprot:950474-Amphidinium_carterae.1